MMKHDSVYLLAEQPYYNKTRLYEDFIHGVMGRLNKGTALNIINSLTLDFRLESNNCLSSSPGVRKMIVAGISDKWLSESTARLISLGIHPVIACLPADTPVCGGSGVCFDFYSVSATMAKHMLAAGRSRITLFGMSPDVHSARLKAEGCHSILSGIDGSGTTASDAVNGKYVNRSSIQECSNFFLPNIMKYDAILCLNDYSALCLMRALKSKGIVAGADIAIASYGDTIAGRVSEPSLTSAIVDYHEAGRKAVEIFNALEKDPILSSMLVTIKCGVAVRDSSGSSNPRSTYYFSDSNSNDDDDNNNAVAAADDVASLFTAVKHNTACTAIHDSITSGCDAAAQFYNDPDINEVNSLEHMLRLCDDFDGLILEDIANGVKYEDMAEHLNMSEKTVQYRLNKMLTSSRKKTRSDLMALLEKYLGSAAAAGARIAREKKLTLR